MGFSETGENAIICAHMKLAAAQIRTFLAKREDERVEFKRATSALPDNLWETYSAFCNTDGGTSDARNTAIFNIFALVDIGERSGMGLANLHGLWKKYGYAEPKITESYDPDRTVIVVTTDDDTVNGTVTRPESGAEPDQNPTRTRPEVDNKVDNNAEGDNKTGSIGDNNPFRGDNKHFGGDNNHGKGDNKNEQRRPFAELFASAKQVFKALSDDNSMTQQGLCAKLGFSRKTIAKAIAVLIRERYIIRRGARKNGYWEVLDNR